MTSNRTWLIRTKQNKILGPVSKEKIIELVNSGSLTDEDELCSGNGYWFWLKETELVDKYVHGNSPQGFNPVAEASTMLANTGAAPVGPEVVGPQSAPQVASSSDDSEEEPLLFPEDDDLGYPDLAETPKKEDSNNLLDEILDFKPSPEPSGSAKPAASANVSDEVTEDGEAVILPDEDDLEFPDLIIPEKKETPSEELKIEAPPAPKTPKVEKVQELDLAANEEEEGPVILPEEDDLEYPDMDIPAPAPAPAVEDVAEEKVETQAEDDLVLDLGSSSSDDDIDGILSEEKAQVKEEAPLISEETEKNADQLLGAEAEVEEQSTPQEMPKPKKKKRKRKKKKAAQPKAPPKRNDRVMIYALLLIVLVILYGVYFYYTQILGQSFVLKKFDPIFNEAQAQEKSYDVKKKSL